MVKDEQTGESFRADHLVKDHIDKLLKKKDIKPADREKLETDRAKVDLLNATELDEMIRSYNIKAPNTSNPLGNAFPFQLMFSTQIGPTGKVPG